MRNTAVALALVSALLLTIAGPGLASANDEPLAPALDVTAAIQALEREQVHRAPGAIATYDEELVHAAMAPDMRLLVSPYTGELGPDGRYPSTDAFRDEVIRPLRDWAEENAISLIHVQGLSVLSAEGVGMPATHRELRQQMAHLDVTESVLKVLRAVGPDRDQQPRAATFDPVVEPTSEQLGELAGRLERDRVYNAAERTDPIELPLPLVEEQLGFTVRAAALPAVPRGEPLVDYAPALAQRFPGDVILVAYGPWLEIAGPDSSVLTASRDYAYGRFERATLRQGLVMNDRIGTTLRRASDVLTDRAFGPPAPPQPRQVIVNIAPWVLVGSAVVLGGFSLLGWGARRTSRARARQAQLLDASAETYADIAKLGQSLLGADNSPVAAERHSTAVALFEQARTAEAMAEVRKVAREGLEWQRADDERDRHGAP